MIQSSSFITFVCGALGAAAFSANPRAAIPNVSQSRLSHVNPYESISGRVKLNSALHYRTLRDDDDHDALAPNALFKREALRAYLGGSDDPNIPWMQASSDQIGDKMQGTAFPCPFARLTYKKDAQQVAFVNQHAQGAMEQLRDQLVAYTEFVKADGSMFRPLVVFFKPEPLESVTDYHQKGWDILQMLHDHDASPWPESIPKDTEHFLWSFCFNGVALSVNVSNPLQAEHQARDLGNSMVLVFNPRQDFDAVAGPTRGGRQTRENIRAALERYESKPRGHTLGAYGDPDNLEWRQYTVAESNGLLPEHCPLNITDQSNELS